MLRLRGKECDVCIILNSVCNYLGIGTTIIHCDSNHYCMYDVIPLLYVWCHPVVHHHYCMRMCSGCARGHIQFGIKRFTKQTEFA